MGREGSRCESIIQVTYAARDTHDVSGGHTYKAFGEPYFKVRTIRPGRGALFSLYFPATDSPSLRKTRGDSLLLARVRFGWHIST